MLKEEFTCVDKDFTEADNSNGTVAALYESKNFRLTVGYNGAYNKDKQNKRFIKSAIVFMLRPTSQEMKDRYPSIGYNNTVSPYNEDRLMPMDDCPKLGKMSPSNYKIYNELFTFTNEVLENILPQYFPKDADYVGYTEY